MPNAGYGRRAYSAFPRATSQSLLEAVNTSEFGIFVFSPDDAVGIRGKLFSAPRDNVVYELGLFSAALGPERCFFVIPDDADIRLPSNLSGMTAGLIRGAAHGW
jgi:predicted nucleotide-binding protein